MRDDLWALLRCPFSGSALEVERVVASGPEGEIGAGVLRSASHRYPVLAGIPILTSRRETAPLLHWLERGDARRALLQALLPPHPKTRIGRRLLALAQALRVTFLTREAEARWLARTERELVGAESFEDALDFFFRRSAWQNPETFNYFFHRRSDPTFLVGLATLACLEPETGPILDLGCGAGHYVRTFIQATLGSPVVGMDDKFVLLYLAKKFIAPDGAFVCASAERPLPFRDGTFAVTFCADAFFDIEGQGRCAGELVRVMRDEGIALLPHLHNPAVPSPYPGQHPLPPGVYRELFVPLAPRLFSERAILDDYLADRFLDLARQASDEEIDGEPSFVLVGTRRQGFSRKWPPFHEPFRIEGLCPNPLYRWRRDAAAWRGAFTPPSEAYLREYPALRRYLPAEAKIPADFSARSPGDPEILELVRHRLLLPLPPRYSRWQG